MLVFDAWEANKHQVARIADDVREEARATGTTVSYTERGTGNLVIVDWPDGRRELRLADSSWVPWTRQGD